MAGAQAIESASFVTAGRGAQGGQSRPCCQALLLGRASVGFDIHTFVGVLEPRYEHFNLSGPLLEFAA